VRLASNTKTFVAAAILRLWEEGRLALDASLVDHLPSDALQVLARDGYQPAAITIRHLLTHTSGLFDYGDSPVFGRTIEADPTHRWTRTEQLQAAMDGGDPYGPPGEVYRYSDTGYILLGDIIERTSGQPLAAALRQLLDYAQLGLASTWLETLEPPPAGAKERAHQYLGDVDTCGWDPSFDLYGGGGLVSTVGDLARFIRGLFTGGVYKRPATSETMLTTIMAERGGPAYHGQRQVPGVYRMGVAVRETDGVTIYMHGGFWGTLAAYVPSVDVAISATVTQQQAWPRLREMFGRALTLVRAAVEAQQAQGQTPAQGK
jgi:D-alanyl-D-alanine carboxypeptidase